MSKFTDLIKYVDENKALDIKNREGYKALLNVNTPKAWVKEHPFAKGVKYLPIDKTEALLDVFFQEWRVEILSITQLAQSIVCTIRLHYKDPISSDWTFHDGVGAVPLKTKKGTPASDLGSILSDAVATGAPAAKSFAIKDAADHIGKIFGRDLNRKDAIAFPSVFADKQQSADDQADKLEQYSTQLKQAKTLSELQSVFIKLPADIKAKLNPLKNELKTKLGAN